MIVKIVSASAPVIKISNDAKNSDTFKVVPMPGPAGEGVPVGGTTGQVLAKASSTNYDTTWIDQLSQENIQDYVAPLFTHSNHTYATVAYQDALNQLQVSVTGAPYAEYTSVVKHQVKLAEAIGKGQAVYVSSSSGTNMLVSKASNITESMSSKTMGLLATGGVTNDFVYVVTEGLLAGLDTSTANAGDPVWLGTNGNLIYGLTNKPYAPAHLVFIGIVTRKNANNGEIFIKVQNGFELSELHTVDVLTTPPSPNDLLAYDSGTSLWKNKSFNTLGLLTSATAASTYLTQSNAASTYLTQSNASSTYLTQANASSTYLTQANAALTYVSLSGSYSNPSWITGLAWSKISSTPTTLAGYGITDALTSSTISSTYAPLASPTFTGIPLAPTATAGTNTTQIATTEFVSTAVSNLIGGASSALDTLNELALALGNDANFATTITNSLAGKANLSGGNTLSGTQTIQTGGDANKGLVIKANSASQTANLFEIQSAGGSVINRIGPDNAYYFGTSGSLLSSNGRILAIGTNTTVPVITVKAPASITANIQEWQDSTGTVQSYVGSGGFFVSKNGAAFGTSPGYANTAVSISTGTTTNKGLVVQGVASQTASLQEWQNSSGTVLSYVDAAGNINFSGTGSFAQASTGRAYFVVNSASAIPLQLRGAASQTANLQEWQNSSGTVLTNITASGSMVLRPVNFAGNVSAGITLTDNGNNWTAGGMFIKSDSGGNPRLGFQAINTASEALSLVGGQVGINTTTPGSFGSGSVQAQLAINNALAAGVGLVVRAASSQTANLQEWQNSSGGNVAYIASNGYFNTSASAGITGSLLVYGGSTITASGAGAVAFIAKGVASQTANLQEWQNNSATVLASVSAGGTISTSADVRVANGVISYGYTNVYSALISVAGGTPTTESTLILRKRNTSETGSVIEYQSSASAVLGGANANGQIYTGSTAPLTSGVGGATVSTSGTGTTATVVLTSAPNVAVGDRITVAGITPTAYNGTFIVTAVSNTSPFSVSYASTATGAQTVAGTVSVDAQASITARSAGTVSMILRGPASANILNIQDSSGTLRTFFASDGRFTNNTGININNIGGTDYTVAITMAGSRSVQLGGGAASIGGGNGVVGITNANTVPTSNPTGGGILYVNSGALSYIGTSGTGQAIINADGTSPFAKLSGGNTFIGVNTFTGSAISDIPLVSKAIASQTADLFQVQNSSGTVMSGFGISGHAYVRTIGNQYGASLSIATNNNTNMGIALRGNSAQTADLFQYQNSSAVVLGGRNPNAQIYSGATAPDVYTVGGATTAASGDGTTATITTTSTHYLAVGDIVVVAGVTPTGYNGTFVLTAVGTNTISYANATTGAQTVAGTVSTYAQATFVSRSASTKALVVKAASNQSQNIQEWKASSGGNVMAVTGGGRLIVGSDASATFNASSSSSTQIVAAIRGAASQTADLMQWQNSAATVLAKVDSSGNFFATSKSFLIDHPTQEGKKLRYGSLEGPEHGVYVRGKLENSNIIELPEYWTELVDQNSITVQLTPIGRFQNLYVQDVVDNKVYVAGEEEINCYFMINAERKDIDKIVVEE